MLNLNLNYRHLYYFWAVAKEGHLTRVASQLRVAQSALSSQIRQLESDLGHELFNREGRKLTLTEVGHIVLAYADSIFAMGAEMIAAISDGEGQLSSQLRIGSVATLSRNFQEEFLRPLLATEDIQLVLQSGSLEELLERLEVHKLHLLLSNRPVISSADNLWHCRRIAQQKVCLIGPPRKKGKFRFPEDLSSLSLILPGYSSDIRSAFNILCEDLQITPKVFAEVDDMALLRLLARTSGSVAVAPTVVVKDELDSGLLENYCEIPNVFENFYAITAERQFQPAILRELL